MRTRIVEYIKDRQSTLASGLAALLIIVAGFLVFNYFSGLNKTQAPSLTPESTQTSQLNGNQNLGGLPATTQPANPAIPSPQSPTSPTSSTVTYTVVSGDSLSQIAAKYYGDGNKWNLIAAANHLANPSVIHAGNVLTVPNATAATNPPVASANGSGAIKSGSTYTVKGGDTLWSIAQTAYGSGYKWYLIDQANSPIQRNTLGKPLIAPGQVLKIP